MKMERVYIVQEYSGLYLSSRIVLACKTKEQAEKEKERLRSMVADDNDDMLSFTIVDTMLK